MSNDVVTYDMVREFLGDTLHLLNLDYVHVELIAEDSESIDGGNLGTCYDGPEGMSATIVIALDHPWGEVRSTVIHEVCHILVWELKTVVEYTKDEVGASAWAILRRVGEEASERLVIRLERALSTLWEDDE